MYLLISEFLTIDILRLKLSEYGLISNGGYGVIVVMVVLKELAAFISTSFLGTNTISATYIVNLEAWIFSETSTTMYQWTRSHIPEDMNLYRHCNENLRSGVIHVFVCHIDFLKN
jgi:hypothetical protein